MSDAEDKRNIELLAAFGADRVRWPDGTSKRRTADDPPAELEARAIDRLLDCARDHGGVDPERHASLADLIVARAVSDAASARVGAAADRTNVVALQRFGSQRKPFLSSSMAAGAGAILAASLVLGVLLGNMPSIVTPIGDIAAATVSGAVESEVALIEEFFTAAEDTL